MQALKESAWFLMFVTINNRYRHTDQKEHLFTRMSQIRKDLQKMKRCPLKCVRGAANIQRTTEE